MKNRIQIRRNAPSRKKYKTLGLSPYINKECRNKKYNNVFQHKQKAKKLEHKGLVFGLED